MYLIRKLIGREAILSGFSIITVAIHMRKLCINSYEMISMLFSSWKVSKVKYLATIIIFCDYFMRSSTEKRKMDIIEFCRAIV